MLQAVNGVLLAADTPAGYLSVVPLAGLLCRVGSCVEEVPAVGAVLSCWWWCAKRPAGVGLSHIGMNVAA